MLVCVTIAHVVEWALREEKFREKKGIIAQRLLLSCWFVLGKGGGLCEGFLSCWLALFVG